MSSPGELLSLLIAHESQIVTYRRLCRELKVHANTAKQMLDDYYQAHKSDCQATFLITGTRLGSSVNSSSDNMTSNSQGNAAMCEFVVRLVTESELSSVLENVGSSYYHVYSVGPKVTATRQALAMANVVAGCNRDMADQCAVASSVERVINADGSHSRLSKPASPPPTKPDVKPNIMEEEPQADNTPVSRAAEKDKKSFFGRSMGTRKHEKKPASNAKESSPPMPEDPPKSGSKTSPAPEQDEYANADSLPRVEDMFMDDDDDDFEDRHVDISEQDFANADNQAVAKDIQDVEMANADSVDDKVCDNSKKDDSSSVQQPESQSGGRRRVRKRRKINKIKHTKNNRGMLVSEAVEEWESYSESESEPEPRPQVTKRDPGGSVSGTKRTAAKSGKSAVPQRSILSFFGKK
ncbi:CDC27 protein [Coemansia sp. RSA 988]|nr:CDC27 protein [Coemansia sp. RSA 988]